MSWSLVTDPLIAPIWLTALGVLALAAILGAAWLRAPGTIYRTAAFAVLLALLANPTLREEDREPIDDVAVVLIDHSASMKLGEIWFYFFNPMRCAYVPRQLKALVIIVSRQLII